MLTVYESPSFVKKERIIRASVVEKINPTSMIHLTEKPVELAARAMLYSSKPGENVLDLFGGSGSTLIAAQHTGRRAFLMEIDPPYCDVIVQRWENVTGQKAEQIPAVNRLPGRKRKIG
jgi:DNA modification methylase